MQKLLKGYKRKINKIIVNKEIINENSNGSKWVNQNVKTPDKQ